MDNCLANRPLRRSSQDRKKVITILRGIRRQALIRNRSRRRHKIREASELVRDSAGADVSRPSHNERNSMAPFPNIGLLAAPACIRAMRELRLVLGLPI